MSCILFFLSVSGLAYYCFALFAGVSFFRDKSDPSESASAGSAGTEPDPNLPAISVLKPISGVDEQTYECLASFCRQNYPRFEIIFGVQKEGDRCIRIIEQLCRDFPNVDIRYAVTSHVLGANSKVNNLATAYNLAKHDLLVLSDSDVCVTPDYLRHLARVLSDATIDVVTCPYRSRSKGLIATFETLGVATESFPIDLMSRALEGMTFAMGPTIAIRRSALESIGRFEAIADYLHDDYQLGNVLSQKGHQIVLSHHIVDHVMGPESWSDFFHRQTRWSRGTRCSRPLGYLGLVFSFGTIWSTLFLLVSRGSAMGWLMFTTVWGARYLMAWQIGVRYLGDESARNWLPLVPLRDLISFIFWICGFGGARIVWRGRPLRLLRKGKLADVGPVAQIASSVPHISQSSLRVRAETAESSIQPS